MDLNTRIVPCWHGSHNTDLDPWARISVLPDLPELQAEFDALNDWNDQLITCRALELGLPDDIVAEAQARLLARLPAAGGIQ